MSNNSGSLTLTVKKIFIIFLVISLVCCNFIIIGKNAFKSLISYALNETDLPDNPDQTVIKEDLMTNAFIHVNNENKKIIQYKITTGIEAKEIPIKETQIRLRTNIINGYNLEDVKITKINKNSYTVGEWVLEDDKINITLKNDAEDLTEKEQGLDELLVTYIYTVEEGKSLQLASEPEENLEEILNVVEEMAIKTYANDIFIKNQLTTTNLLACTEEPFVTLDIKNKDIHKTTIIEDTTDFIELLDASLKYKLDNLGDITIEDDSNIFLDNEEKEIEGEIAVIYKKTVFNKEDLIELLSLNGVLEIINDEKVLATITKEQIEGQELDAKIAQEFVVETTDESQEQLLEEAKKETRSYITVTPSSVEVEYINEINNVKFRLSNINSEEKGKIDTSNLKIENTKTILNVYDIDSLKYLKTTKKCVFNDVEEIKESTIKFKDGVTRASLEVNNNEWTLGEVNNVGFTIVLDTTTPKSDLFANPMLVLELPERVENVDKEQSQFTIENDNGAFKSTNVNVVTLLGTTYLVINLEGEQTEETVVNGNTTLELALSLKIKGDLQDPQMAKLYYQNNTVTVYENNKSFGMESISIGFINNTPEKQEEETLEEQNETINTQEENNVEQNIEEEQNTSEVAEQEITEDITYNENLAISVEAKEELVKVGDDFYFDIFVDNLSLTNQDNVSIEYKIPDGLKYMDAEIYNYNEETMGYTNKLDSGMLVHYNKEENLLNVNLSFFKPASEIQLENETMIVGSSKLVKIKVRALDLPQNIYSNTTNNKFTVINNGEKCLEQNKQIIISDSFIRVESNKIKEDLASNTVVFEIDAKNEGLFAEGNAEINYVLPDEYIPNYIETSESSYSLADNNITTMVNISPQSTYKIFVYASYKESALEEAKEKSIQTEQNDKTTLNTKNSDLVAEEITAIANTSIKTILNSLNKIIKTDNFITRFVNNLYKGGM